MMKPFIPKSDNVNSDNVNNQPPKSAAAGNVILPYDLILPPQDPPAPTVLNSDRFTGEGRGKRPQPDLAGDGGGCPRKTESKIPQPVSYTTLRGASRMILSRGVYVRQYCHLATHRRALIHSRLLFSSMIPHLSHHMALLRFLVQAVIQRALLRAHHELFPGALAARPLWGMAGHTVHEKGGEGGTNHGHHVGWVGEEQRVGKKSVLRVRGWERVIPVEAVFSATNIARWTSGGRGR